MKCALGLLRANSRLLQRHFRYVKNSFSRHGNSAVADDSSLGGHLEATIVYVHAIRSLLSEYENWYEGYRNTFTKRGDSVEKLLNVCVTDLFIPFC